MAAGVGGGLWTSVRQGRYNRADQEQLLVTGAMEVRSEPSVTDAAAHRRPLWRLSWDRPKGKL